MESPPHCNLGTEGTVKITRVIKSNKPLSYPHNRRYLNPIIPKAYSKKDSHEDHVFTAKQLERQLDLFFDFKPKDAII